MEKNKKRLGITLLSAFAVLFTGFAINTLKKDAAFVKADEIQEIPAPSVTLKGYNLSLRDNIYIMYAIDDENVTETDEFGMLVWRKPQTTYEYGTQESILTSDSTVTAAGQTYSVFYYTELSAYEMTDVVYARAYVEREGEYYYSDISRYSILDYAYNKLGKTLATPTEDEKLERLLESMLIYGAAAQEYADYKTGALATAEFRYLTLENATFADGFSYGLYRAGTEETLSVAEGNEPAGDWLDYISQNANSEYVLNVPEERFSQNLAYTLSEDGTYYILSGIGTCADTELIIPYTYNGLKVKEIAENALKNQTQLKSVNITANIRAIGANAFYGCTGLTELTIGRRVESLGTEVFRDCTALTVINYNATECSDLATNNGIFRNAGRSGLGVNVKIGADVKVIPAALFCSYTGGYYKDEYSPYIKTVEFASGSVCTRIGANAFSYCPSIENINYIPSGVTTIEANTFYNCHGLTEIVIPNTVTAIRGSAFYGCTGVETLTLGTGITTIEVDAFKGCTALTVINYNATECSDLATGNGIFYNAGRSGLGINVKIGANVKVIPAALFCSYTKSYYETYSPYIKTVEFASGSVCTRIGANAFSHCISLENINYIPSGVTTIEANTFYNCHGLTEIVIPNTVTAIRSSAFYGCTGVETLTLGTGITTIEVDAFRECTALTVINYNATECSDLVTGNGIFYNAGRSGLGINVKIGANVKVIPAALFCSYTKSYYETYSPYIKTVEFASGSVCMRIGTNAFSYCPTIESIIYHGTTTQWSAITKGSDWKLNSTALTTVVCDDGTVTI